MLKTICLILIGGFLFSSSAEKKEDNYTLFYPKNIPAGSSFDVALITSNVFPSSDTLELYIAPGSEISLVNIKLKSFDVDEELNFIPASLEGVPGEFYKADISLTDSTLSSGSFFQVLMTFKAEYGNSSNLKLYGVFKDGDKIVGNLCGSRYGMSPQDNFLNVRFNFYQPYKNAGSCLRLNKNSAFQVSLKNVSAENLLTEFSITLNGSLPDFFKVSSKSNSDISYYLSINPFQMLTAQTGKYNIETVSPFFISSGSWYHIAVDLSKIDNSISFYCGGILFSKAYIPSFVKPEDLVFSFERNDKAKPFKIDLLRFIDLENSIEESTANRNYLNFVSDSSTVLAQFDFDAQNEIYNPASGVSLSFSNVSFSRSDAPIFTRAPELNITPFGSSYELDWSGGDYRQAEQYILQKSSGNSGFEDLYSVPADNTSERNYSFADQPDESDDVVYYRVKQMNIDGGMVYSDVVKVGQGLIKPFEVQQNYPNPFNPNTSIAVTLLKDTQLEVTVYNVEGREVQDLYKGYLTKGNYTFNFNAANLPSGIYFCKVATPNFSEMKKMIYTK